MEPEARQLMVDSLNVNFVDVEQYPSSAELEKRCVAMLADLYHTPVPADGRKPTGTATIGSSEAILLAGLALKVRWQERRAAAGLAPAKPNIVMGHNTQVCWEKFARCACMSMHAASAAAAEAWACYHGDANRQLF
jgi:glutamate decarboxylase